MPRASPSLRAPGAAGGVSHSVVGALQQCKITGGVWGGCVPAPCSGQCQVLGMSCPSQGWQFSWQLEVCGAGGSGAAQQRGVGERAQLFGR